jgi:nucleoside-diphosphate-sugar epimerase
VLVTGATGFVGRQALAPLIARGYDVHAVAREPSDAGDGVTWHAADLLDPSATDRLLEELQASHLLHFAWYTVHREYWESPENLRWVGGSLHLVRRFTELGGRRAVLAGTCAEYDWADELCSETETPLAPRTLYGTAKDALRRILDAYAAVSGLSVAWGRIFFLFGPHEHRDRLVASLAQALINGEAAVVANPHQVRDFLHVEEAGTAFAALLDGDVRGAVNVASGEARSIEDIAAVLAEAEGRPDLLQAGAGSASGADTLLLLADVSRLREEVGWTPARTVDQRLLETLEWWRAQSDTSPPRLPR